MQYTVRGRLCGYVCGEVEEPVADATVRLYRARDRIAERATARPKETFAVLDGEAVERKEDRLLTEAGTDAEGSFVADVDEEVEYDGGGLEVDVRLTAVPGAYDEDADPVQVSVTTLQPRWRKAEEGAVAAWEYCFPEKTWCHVRSLFGAWVICGRVTACDEKTGEPSHDPAPGMTVEAFDADIIEDDALGSAVTDEDGHYRVYFSRTDFERTPTPWVNVELEAGPDVYYRVSTGGTTLLEEDRSEGRRPGRENVRHCHREETLCVEPPERDPFDPGLPRAFWTGIGDDVAVPGDVDDEGYATVGGTEYALTGGIQFTGDASVMGLGGAPVEYRFLVSTTTAPNSAPDLPGSTFTRAVGASGEEDLFVPSRLGKVLARGPGTGRITWVSVRSSLDDLDADGWLNVEDAIDRSLRTDPDVGAGLAGATVYAWEDRDELMGLDTRALAPAAARPTLSEAGDAVDPGEEFPIHTISIRFEARNTVSIPLGGGGTTLNSLTVDNNAAVKSLDLDWTGGPCDPVSGTVEVGYTVYHPHLGRAWLTLQKDSTPRSEIDDDASPAATTKAPVTVTETAPGSPTSSDQVHNGHFDITGELDGRCAYIVQVHERRRLHTGYNRVDATHSMAIPFYYEP